MFVILLYLLEILEKILGIVKCYERCCTSRYNDDGSTWFWKKTIPLRNWIYGQHYKRTVTFSKLAIHRCASICIVVHAASKSITLANVTAFFFPHKENSTYSSEMNSDPWLEFEALLNQLCQLGNRAYDRLQDHNTYGIEIKPWSYGLASSCKWTEVFNLRLLASPFGQAFSFQSFTVLLNNWFYTILFLPLLAGFWETEKKKIWLVQQRVDWLKFSWNLSNITSAHR